MRKLFLLAAAAALILPATAQTTWSVTSPNGRIKVSLFLKPKALPEGGALFYRVEHGTDDNRAIVIADSPLGLVLDGLNPWNAAAAGGPGASWGHDYRALEFDRVKSQQPVEVSYELQHGKRRQCQNRANELT